MSSDDYMVDIREIYRQTAEKLYKNEPVTAEEMRRYHGITGMMVARVAAALWSEDQLCSKIDARMKIKCQECKTLSAASGEERWYVRLVILLTPWRWALAFACFSPVLPSVLEKAGQLFGR